MDDQRLTDILANWATWQRRPNINIGFPPRSLVFQPGGAVAVGLGGAYDIPQSEAYADVDDAEARTVQAVVDDLPGRERDSVYNVVLGTRRPLGEALEVVYVRARALLIVRLTRRGIG
jgi:hypothetical protein